ncbi:hypothetical protein ACOMHN_058815 [Nucella lapillus]
MLSRQSAWRSLLPYVLITASSWVAYKLFIKPFLSPLRKIPGRPYRPIVGNMFEVLRAEPMTNAIRWMTEMKSGLIRYYSLYGEERLLTADPAIVKHICVTHSKNYIHTGTQALLKTLMPQFLLLLNGEAHHSLKRLLNPAFSTQAVYGIFHKVSTFSAVGFIPVFDRKTQEMVAQWREQLADGGVPECTVPAQDCMAYVTLDAICECGFDYQLHCVQQPHSAGVQYMKKILEGFKIKLTDMIPLISRLPTKRKQDNDRAIAFFISSIRKVIKDKREKMESGGDCHSGDLLSRLMAARDEQGKALSDNVIFSQVAGFLFAGYEARDFGFGIGLTWALLMLAQYPDVQEKVRQEVTSLLPEQQPITVEMVQQLTYMTAVIKETLRLLPPIPNHFRKTVSEDVIQGYTIPAGTIIGLSSGALHRLPENWSDPESFKPERFLKEYDPYAFLPFSTGPYMCIGHSFAMTEMKVILARLLVNFRFRLPTGYTYRRIRQLTLQPSPPLSLVMSLAANSE